MKNPFSMFKLTETKNIKVVALDNAEVTIRQLTFAETDLLSRSLIKVSEDGKASFDYSELNANKVRTVALAMVEPKMTEEELFSLSANVTNAINEISDAIEAYNQEGKKKA